MKREEISALINRAIGSKGILRASAYWVKRIFNQVLDYSEESTNTAIKVVDKKAEIYILQAGEYALNSETGKKLLEILNNPDKYILQSWVNVSIGKELVGYNASKLDSITDSHILLIGYARLTSTHTVNGKLAEVGFTEYTGGIIKSDDIITVTFSDIGQRISFGKGIDDKMSSTSEYTVSNKAIKEYVDNAVKNVKIAVDDEMSPTSTNPVQNATIYNEFAKRFATIDVILDNINGEKV